MQIEYDRIKVGLKKAKEKQMIITSEIVRKCSSVGCKVPTKFAKRFPEGLDVSPLWGELEDKEGFWQKLLQDKFVLQWLGAAVRRGLILGKVWGDFSNYDMDNSNLYLVNMSGVILSEVNLSGADLGMAVLSEANLEKANLTEAHLKGANLGSANLTGADLSGADLERACLAYANLTGANLTNANLSGADLEWVKFDSSTQWPKDFDKERLE